MPEKINRCDKDGKCTAKNHDELIACQFYPEEEIMRPGTCSALSRTGDNCLHPAALTAKLKELRTATAIGDDWRSEKCKHHNL